MKIVALDTGDVWTGTAISDPLGIVARPYKTVETHQLISFLQELFQQESIETILVGYPKTLRGTESEQTKKTVALCKSLQQQFPQVSWLLWDERLTSKQADQLKHAKTKAEKIHAHSVAAAFILSSYLEYRHLHKQI